MEHDDRPDDRVALSMEERAAVRAYLQRSEVRLSTVHRVATALLSGAGLMVLLPVVGRDAVVDVGRHLATGEVGPTEVALGIAVLAALTVPLAAFVLVLRDLTEFYFHANHVQHPRGETFAPRFTLTALRLPSDELSAASEEALAAHRAADQAIELIVPNNDAARARIDARIAAYGGLGAVADPRTADDRDRAEALFVLAASRSRSLLDEVAKVEHGMVRHVLRVQVIVLRYVKALLTLLTTALAVFAAEAVVQGRSALGPVEEVWLAGIFLLWAPLVVFAVSTPVRWLDHQLRNEGAHRTGIGQDDALTRVERVAVRIAGVGFAGAAAAMALSLRDPVVPMSGRVVGSAVLVVAAAALVTTVRGWSGRGTGPA